MKCISCGKEIPDNSSICPYCNERQPYRCSYCGNLIPAGTRVCPYCLSLQIHIVENGVPAGIADSPDVPDQQRRNDAEPVHGIDGEADEAIVPEYSQDEYEDSGDIKEKAKFDIGADIHDGAAEAWSDLKEGGKRAKEFFVQLQTDQASSPVKYQEMLVVLSPFLPLIQFVVNNLVGPVSDTFLESSYSIGFTSILFNMLRYSRIIIFIIYMALSIASIIAAVYLVATREDKRTAWGYAAVASSFSGILSEFCVHFNWTFVELAIAVICLIWGMDLYSRVMLQGLGIESKPDLGLDYAQFSTSDVQEKNNSYDNQCCHFDGTGGQLILNYILTVVISILTLGIAAPWMICRILRWKRQHTIINGKHLYFNGKGSSLFGNWLLWELLTIVTFGIFGFFMYEKVLKWSIEHTVYEDDPKGESVFDGKYFTCFLYGIIQHILLQLTYGFAWPWTFNLIERWEIRHKAICGDRFYYDGTVKGIFAQYMISYILTVITLGIYMPWAYCRINRYVYSHIHLDQNFTEPKMLSE